VNKSLEEVLQIVAQLPATQQEAIASQILQQITTLQKTSNGELPDPEVLAYMEQQAAIFEQKVQQFLQPR
jgi:hypothetical protein